jgi:sugar lactone lactonase YvrE
MRRSWAAVAAVSLCPALVGLPAIAQEVDTAETGGLSPETLVQGAPIHGANGLAVDGEGRVLVASGFGREIAVLDPETGEVVEHIGPIAGAIDVGQPDDVAVAPDGSICWTDLSGGNVDCLRPDGGIDQQFVAQGVNPIAFTDDGRLFVALAFFGDDLYELDPALIAEPRLIMEGEGDAPWPNQLNGFDFGPDGLLYSPRPFSATGGDIGRIDVDAESPEFETLASGVPVSSVEFDSDGMLHASLPMTGEVAQVDIETGELTPIATLEPNIDNMAFGPGGQLYVSNYDDGRIDVIEADFDVRQLSPPGVILPGGVSAVAGADGADRLYVADFSSLSELDGRTGEVIAVTRFAHIGESIAHPWSVAPDGEHVIITSWMDNLVQIWDPAGGQEVASWPDFAVPVNAIRFGEDLVVAELGTGSVVRQTPEGERLTIGEGLMVPSGLAATDDDLWVTDWAAGSAWQIITNGEVSMTEVATGLANPEGIAVEPDGSLLVVESAIGTLTRILPSGEIVTIAEGLPMGAPAAPGSPPAWAFNGVAIGPSGAIYVASDTESLVWRIREAEQA